MGSIGDIFPYDVPTVGTPNYGDQLVRILDELITRVSGNVPLSALSGATLDLNNQAITGVKDIEFVNQNSAPTAVPGGMYYLNGEWYFVTSSGAIQITNNGAINITVNGGIGGDYGGSNPALVSFSDINQRYDFYDDATSGAFAYLRGKGFDVVNGSSRARINWSGSANIVLNLPPTLPAAGKKALLTIDESGNIRGHDVSPNVNSDLSLDGDLTIANANDIILNGGKISHGARVTSFCAADVAIKARSYGTSTNYWSSDGGWDPTLGISTPGSGGLFTIYNKAVWLDNGTPVLVDFALPEKSLERMLYVLVYCTQVTSPLTVTVYYRDSWGTETQVGTTTSLVVGASKEIVVTLNQNGAPYTASGYGSGPLGHYIVRVSANGSTVVPANVVYTVAYVADVPA